MPHRISRRKQSASEAAVECSNQVELLDEQCGYRKVRVTAQQLVHSGQSCRGTCQMAPQGWRDGLKPICWCGEIPEGWRDGLKPTNVGRFWAAAAMMCCVEFNRR